MERGQLQSVFIAENNIAHIRLVTIGTRVVDKVEVLSGLNQGDRVIVPIPTGLADGAPIEVRQ
jgi:multidrug efflux pump subunit AcrA (membrane-fusion protein)